MRPNVGKKEEAMYYSIQFAWQPGILYRTPGARACHSSFLSNLWQILIISLILMMYITKEILKKN